MTFNLVVQTKLAVSTLWRQIRLNLKEEVYVNSVYVKTYKDYLIMIIWIFAIFARFLKISGPDGGIVYSNPWISSNKQVLNKKPY